MPQSPQGDLQFDLEKRADGIRIYARYGNEIIGGLDAESCGDYLAISALYVVPSWRNQAIEEALQVQFFRCLERYNN